MQRLRQDMEKKTFAPVYLIYGDEGYLKQSFKKQMKEAIIGEDTMNFTQLIGKDIDVKTVGELAVTMPFMTEKRLILLEDTGLFKAQSDPWVELLDSLPETTCIIFIESEVDKRNKLYKKVTSMGYAAEMVHPDEEMLTKWIMGYLKKNHLSITREGFQRLLMCGNDMEMLFNELSKVCDYCMGKEGITAEDVDNVCCIQLENRVFEMIEAMAIQNQEKALKLYYDLLALKEPTMRILFLIGKQMNQLMLVKGMSAAGKGKDVIAKLIKVPPFVAGKLINQSRNFSLSQLEEYVRLCVLQEEAVKVGNLSDTMAVELLIIQISEKK